MAAATALVLYFAASPALAASLAEQLGELAETTNFVPDKALVALRKMEDEARSAPLPARAEYLQQLSEALRGVGRHEEARAVADQLVQLGRDERDSATRAKGLLAQSAVLLAVEELENSHQLAWEAERVAAQTTDLALQAETAVASGKAHAAAGDFPVALTRLQEAVALARRAQDTRRLVGALNALAILYGQIKEYHKGFAVLAEAMPLAAGLDSPGRMSTLTDTEYGLAVETGQHERGLKALLAGLAYERRIGATSMMATSLVNLSDSYLKSQDYPRTVQYASEALALGRKINHPGNVATAQLNLGQGLIGLGRLAEGKRYVDAGLAWYEKLGDKPELQGALIEYASALERSGDLAGALQAYRRERTLSNELFEERRQQALMELQAQYEADNKQHRIDTLQRENAAKSAQLHSQRVQQRLWWGLAAVCALACLVVGVLYRKVRRANALLQLKNTELKHQSARDPLTGLYNRRHFQEFMRAGAQRRLLASAATAAATGANGGVNADERAGALFLLDVDHFKLINDTWGHAAGDAVLKMCAQKLHDVLRETDMIVRWGGEEFVAYLPAAPHGDLEEVARRLLRGLSSEAVVYQGTPIHVQVSIGYAPFPLAVRGQQLPWEQAINLVDMALYMAKGHGRNRAYGIKSLAKTDAMSLEEIEQDLELAWRAGLVELSVVTGEAAAARSAA
jgi:diguanylate cyclase (GGDEF)-like protein